MDILRKELNAFYASQYLERENRPLEAVAEIMDMARAVVQARGGCVVITDASCDRCYIHYGAFGKLMGFALNNTAVMEHDSSDEDIIYNLIHPEDLVDKRFLEYEFFNLADGLADEEKLSVHAACRLRMKDKGGKYRHVDNSTRVIRLTPGGKIWLIMCTYDLSAYVTVEPGIMPAIINASTGETTPLSFDNKRRRVLSDREKEVLRLIREGMPSKHIADALGISVHTVNRHRQNIISKLSVGNSIEAVTAAMSMKLL